MLLTYTLDNITETAERILRACPSKTILFYGDMGIGKTTLIKKLVKLLNSNDIVTSPTFSLVNEYRDGTGSPIYHFDFYRLNDEKEAQSMGFEEYFEKEAWIFIEWPEKINKLLPLNVHTAKIKSTKEGHNEILITSGC